MPGAKRTFKRSVPKNRPRLLTVPPQVLCRVPLLLRARLRVLLPGLRLRDGN
jgi:hypothetical protein